MAQWRSAHAVHASDPDQLYDLRVDPSECINLYGNREYSDVGDEMKQLLKDWLTQMPGPFAELRPVSENLITE